MRFGLTFGCICTGSWVRSYESEFKSLIKSKNMHYIETYNASEGFFALQDNLESRDMALR